MFKTDNIPEWELLDFTFDVQLNPVLPLGRILSVSCTQAPSTLAIT